MESNKNMVAPVFQVKSRLSINVVSVMDGKNICNNQQQYSPRKNVKNKSLPAIYMYPFKKKNINLFKVADN